MPASTCGLAPTSDASTVRPFSLPWPRLRSKSQPGDLTRRALSASGWTVGGHLATQVIRFGSNLVMTRLLVPDMFGVMALAFTFMFALSMFSDLGLRQVVTQSKRGAEPLFLNIIWTVQLIRGAVIFVLGAAIALLLYVGDTAGWLPPDTTYGHPDLPYALFLIALTSLISGAESTRLLTLGRDLTLARSVVMDLMAQLVGFAVMIAWALWSPTVTALCVGAIVSALMRLVLSHTWIPGIRDHLRWETETFLEIFRFGRWVFVSSILGFLTLALDKVILGWQLDARQFGIYSIAVLLVMAVYDICQRIVSAVLFPALSEVHRTAPERLKATYYRMRIPVEAASYLSGTLLVVAGSLLVSVLYDTRYHEAGALLQIMAVSLFVTGVNASAQIYLVIGKPWLMTFLIAVRLAALAVALPLLTWRFGLVGTAWGIVVSHLVTIPFLLELKRRHGVFDIGREVLALVPIVAATVYALTMS